MSAERLTKAAVAERALVLGDEEGLDAITIRRLAQELGVTPMALYWHFKNKEELLLGIVDHALEGVRADRDADDPWPRQLRAMLETVVDVLRRHPVLPDLLHAADKKEATSFARASNDALAVLAKAGFDVQEGYWIATYLLHGAIGLVEGQPDCPPTIAAGDVAEWRRQRRIALECLPADQFPMLVRYGATLAGEPDPERYYAFGIDLLIAGIETLARQRAGTTS